MGSGPFNAGTVAAHVADVDPHGDRAYAEQFAADLMGTHEGLPDPHGDRAYAAALVAALNLQTFLPTYTWATLPAAAANNGKRVHVSDVGEGGSDWKSNGTLWLPVNGAVLLARSAVAASVTGTLLEVTLATINIPAGLMGLNGQVRITTLWSAGASNVNSKTCVVRFGGNAYLGANIANNLTLQSQQIVRNRNAANSQVGFLSGTTVSYGMANAVKGTSAVNTAASTDIAIAGQLGNTGDTLTLESYTVELLR